MPEKGAPKKNRFLKGEGNEKSGRCVHLAWGSRKEREIRHTDQYSFNFFASSEEAEDAIEKSRAFVARIKKLLDEKSKKK